MTRRLLFRAWVVAAVAAGGGLLAAGCGEKIAIPEPEGSFGIYAYVPSAIWADNDPRQLAMIQGNLVVVSADGLTKRNQSYELLEQVGGLADARAVCVEQTETWVFVWEQGSRQVSWYGREHLEPGGATPLEGPLRVTAMATSPAGIDSVPGALTFLYLSDAEAGVIWRYAFDEFAGLTPYGLLARSDGNGARFVHVAAGLARQRSDHLLVCDADTARNWVIRFDATPDETDGDLRGRAALFNSTSCPPDGSASDYVLGNAATCGETDWVGGTSAADGEFNTPLAVAVDGRGRIFVADTENNRIQVFLGGPGPLAGDYSFSYGNEGSMPAPACVAVYDYQFGVGADDFFYAGWLFVIPRDGGEVRRFKSHEWAAYDQDDPPPPDIPQ